jgi:hypothetical protein
MGKIKETMKRSVYYDTQIYRIDVSVNGSMILAVNSSDRPNRREREKR